VSGWWLRRRVGIGLGGASHAGLAFLLRIGERPRGRVRRRLVGLGCLASGQVKASNTDAAECVWLGFADLDVGLPVPPTIKEQGAVAEAAFGV
jgi:hypothetical protein